QAERGAALYQSNCRRCHGESAEGSKYNPTLKGEKFIDNWREDTLENLFIKLSKTMHRNDPGVLKEAEYLDLLAYILQSNGSPAGTTELNTAALRTIQVEGRDGPKPLPNRAIVQVIGCMTQGNGDDWIWTLAPLPTRTSNPDKITSEELKAAETKPLGTLKFQLQNLEILGDFIPENHVG